MLPSVTWTVTPAPGLTRLLPVAGEIEIWAVATVGAGAEMVG
jgi:hypothetical protein